jgi:hypothetical protein
MENKGLQIFTIFLDAINFIIAILTIPLKLNGIVTGLSLLAVLAFSSIWFIEHKRNIEVANIKVETPRLTHAEVMMRDSGSRARMSLVAGRIEDWNKEQEQRIQETNAKYLGQEKLVFGIGVLITIIIACFFAFPALL